MSQSTLAFNEATSPAIFNFGAHAVRIVLRDGEPWFVASDVCAALEYTNTSKAVADHLDDDERMTLTAGYGQSGNGLTSGSTATGKRGGARFTVVINESGLYALVLRSRKPEARKFAKWVTSEVLPSIRKTGRYEKPGCEISMPELAGKMVEWVDATNGYPIHLFLPVYEAIRDRLQRNMELPRLIDATDAPAMAAARKVALDYFDAYRAAVKEGKTGAPMADIPPEVLHGMVASALMNQRMLVSFDYTTGRMNSTLLPGDASVVSFTRDRYFDVAQHIPMDRIPEMLSELSARVGCHLSAFRERLNRDRATFGQTAPGVPQQI